MATRLEILRKSPVVKSAIDAVFLRNKMGGEIGGDDVMREPYKKSDLVYVCISTTARAISQIPIVISRPSGNSGGNRPLPPNDPWNRLFDHPNYLTDRYSFTESIITHLLLDGDVFAIPFPPGLPSGVIPDSIWIVKKMYMKPDRNPSTGQLNGWWYNPKGIQQGGIEVPMGSIPLLVDDVSHIFLFNPYDPIMGLSPLEAGRINVVVDYKAAFYTSVFFDEGAVPGGVISTEQKLGDKQFNRTREQFEARHGGYKKGHRVALLEQGLKYSSTGLSQKDMEYKSLRELTSERIYQIFGMKKAVVSVMRDVNYATAREERKEWWETTNIPLMNMVASALSFNLFTEGELTASFDLTKVAALKEAMKEKVETGYKLWQMGYTADEVNDRLDFGFNSKPWRKTWYMPVNLVPVNGTPILPEEETPPPKLPPPKPPKLIGNSNKDARDNQIWEGFVVRLAPLEEMFSKKTSRVFFDMRKRTLELLYREAKTPKDVDDELYSDETKEMAKLSDPLYREALAVGITSFIEETGIAISFNLDDPEAISFLANKNLKIRGIVQTVKDQIKSELIEAFEKGETVDQIADRIRGVFDIAKSRARTIARTEIIGAANESRAIALNRSGFKEKQWFTAMDEKVRPTHMLMHGKVVKVGEMWTLPSGVSLRHPGDYNGPASEIVNCRCIEIVVPGSHYLES